jgi:hypothetical protein
MPNVAGSRRALHEGVLQDPVGIAANLEVAAGSLDSDPRRQGRCSTSYSAKRGGR